MFDRIGPKQSQIEEARFEVSVKFFSNWILVRIKNVKIVHV